MSLLSRSSNSVLPRFINKLFKRKSRRLKLRKIRPRLRLWSAVTDGIGLHEQMYRTVTGNNGNGARIMEADMELVRRLCAESLRDQLIPLIRNRRQDQSVTWEIKGVWPHVTSRVVSNQVSNLPRDNCAIRQTVVKIQSQQRVLRYDHGDKGKEKPIPGTDQWTPMTEYLVMQKRILDGVEESWRIWGMAEESSYQEVLEIDSTATESKAVVT